MKCLNCKSDEVIKVYDSKNSFRGIDKDDKDIFSCPKCHTSWKIDRATLQITISQSINGKVGGKRVPITIPLVVLSQIR